MSTGHNSTPEPIQVAIHPGYWLAHTTDGRIVACCEEPRQLEREVRRAGIEPADVQLLQVPDQNDDELLLGGCEWSLDEERLNRTPAPATEPIAGGAASPASSVSSGV